MPWLGLRASGNFIYLKAVLVRHELLGFPLIDRLCGAPGGLCGHASSSGSAGALCQVEVCYLDADLITHNVLELKERELVTGW